MKKKRKTDKLKLIQALRKVWLRSNVRADRLKQDSHTCQKCGKKKTVSDTKLENEPDKYCKTLNVHHIDGHINWELVCRSVFHHLLVEPNKLLTLCKECHNDEHKKG